MNYFGIIILLAALTWFVLACGRPLYKAFKEHDKKEEDNDIKDDIKDEVKE